MWNKIKNPKTGRFVNVHGLVGKSIIKKYIMALKGGSFRNDTSWMTKKPQKENDNPQKVPGKIKHAFDNHDSNVDEQYYHRPGKLSSNLLGKFNSVPSKNIKTTIQKKLDKPPLELEYGANENILFDKNDKIWWSPKVNTSGVNRAYFYPGNGLVQKDGRIKLTRRQVNKFRNALITEAIHYKSSDRVNPEDSFGWIFDGHDDDAQFFPSLLKEEDILKDNHGKWWSPKVDKYGIHKAYFRPGNDLTKRNGRIQLTQDQVNNFNKEKELFLSNYEKDDQYSYLVDDTFGWAVDEPE